MRSIAVLTVLWILMALLLITIPAGPAIAEDVGPEEGPMPGSRINGTTRLPDLVLDGIIRVRSSTEELGLNVPCYITIDVKNIGDWYAENITVTLLENDVETNRTVIDHLAINQSRTVNFTWIMVPNNYKLSIEIDPENTIEEHNDQEVNINNNKKSRSVMVCRPPGRPENDGFTFSWNIYVLLVALLVFLILLMVAVNLVSWMRCSRKKKTGQP